MFEFDKLCEKYETMSFDDLKTVVVEESAVFMPALLALGSDGVEAFMLFVSAACGASGELELAEYKLFEEATGISVSYEAACALVESAKGKEAQKLIDELVDTLGELDEEIKASMISFTLAFCAANGYIGFSERRFIKKLIK